MNGGIFDYEGFVEVNVQIPGRDFSEDHLFLVISEIIHQKEIPVVVGTYFIASLSEYLKTLEKEIFDALDPAIQQAYYSWEEAAKIREKYGCEPPLGVVKTTKPVTIYAGERKEIHGLTKIKHGGYSVNCISEPVMEKALQGGHSTGKTGNLAVNFSRQGKHREFSKFYFLHRENCANTGKILKIWNFSKLLLLKWQQGDGAFLS